MASLRGAVLVAACVLAASVVAVSAQESKFYVLGDWGASTGSHNVKHQVHVAETMASLAGSLQPEFLINVGDNFYESGVTSTTDSQWTSKWLDVYITPSSEDANAGETALNELLWYSVLGNHDYIENPQAQVEYSQLGMGGGRWIMPQRYYAKVFQAGSMTLEFVFIDTIMLSNATVMNVARREVKQGIMTRENLERTAEQIRREATVNPADVQLAWLEKTLAASTADWLFVVGHFPVYSAGANGDTPELKAQVKPLLEKYNVDTYFSGHDHTLQYLYKDDVHYIVSGAGCKDESHKLKSKSELVWGLSEVHGFVSITLNETDMTSTFYDDHSNVLQQVSQHRRSKL